jgi:hypothetical protein
MENEKELTSGESLELIARTINDAKNEFRNTGISILYWGAIVTVCALVTFLNYYLRWHWLDYIWFLTIAAIIPQVFINKKEREERKFKTLRGELIGGIWLSFGIAIALLFLIPMFRNIPQIDFVFLILYGIPTFATGYGCKCTPMIIGGIACWIFAVVSLYTPNHYMALLNAGAALLAWFIPGLILRREYLKAKEEHV